MADGQLTGVTSTTFAAEQVLERTHLQGDVGPEQAMGAQTEEVLTALCALAPEGFSFHKG